MHHLRISLVFWLCLSFIMKVHADLVRCLVGFFPSPCCSFVWILLTSKVKHMKIRLNIRNHFFTVWNCWTLTLVIQADSAFPGVIQSLAGHNPGQCVLRYGLDNVKVLFPTPTILWLILWWAQHLKAAEAGHRVPGHEGRDPFYMYLWYFQIHDSQNNTLHKTKEWNIDKAFLNKV